MPFGDASVCFSAFQGRYNELLSKCQLVITYQRPGAKSLMPDPLTYPNISCIEEISANKKSHDRKRTGEFFLTPKSGLCWQILTAHIWLTTHRVARGSCNGGQFIRVQREAFRKPDSAQRQVLHPSAAVNNNLHPIELQEVVAHQGLMIFGRFVDFGGIGLLYTGSHINERAMKKSHLPTMSQIEQNLIRIQDGH